MDFKKEFSLNLPSKQSDKCTVLSGNVRIGVLTENLFRVEFSQNGEFVDLPTQKVWCRQLEDVRFSSEKKSGNIIVKTNGCELCVNAKNGSVRYAIVNGNKITNFSKGNLKGTYRTLDGTFGAIPLGEGVVSKNGGAIFDDSNSLLLNRNGTVSPRKSKEKDYYIFAYGRNYRKAVSDFITLTGGVPLVPRFCLGNWWSRYKAYTQEEYIALMQRFLNEEIPISVATIDMDWHWTDVKSRFSNQLDSSVQNKNPYIGTGWTGYSWNTELFPNYKEFLKWLKAKNFKVTVNLHPAEGVHFYEDMYSDFAKAVGADAKSKKCIEFDCTSPEYMQAYFEILHHPYENDGVDFWWIDWQQGKKSKLPGLDPLWALNHYHYLDSARNGKRGLILSRFAEPGSQRYPLGFSGDTKVCWNCLDFQPYSTAAASNIGYTWWSHDIGGHYLGKKDDELYVRWLQFGVFSPINRLHSTNNEFMGKEPWNFRFDAQILAKELLRLRHRLIPYIYSMNYRTYKEHRALIEPMYYEYPNNENAYKYKNEYLFGSELIAAPITKPASRKTNLSSVEVWLPEGRYTDIFNNRIYEGNQVVEMFRGIESIPVLAKEGSIIPLDVNCRTNCSENPVEMEILAYRGNGKFTLYEDDGESLDFEKGAFAQTMFEIKENGDCTEFIINCAQGDLSVIPEKRNYIISFKDIVKSDSVSVEINGEKADFDLDEGKEFVCINLNNITPFDNVKISLIGVEALKNNSMESEIVKLVSKYQESVVYKQRTFSGCAKGDKKIPKCRACYRKPIEEIFKMKY